MNRRMAAGNSGIRFTSDRPYYEARGLGRPANACKNPPRRPDNNRQIPRFAWYFKRLVKYQIAILENRRPAAHLPVDQKGGIRPNSRLSGYNGRNIAAWVLWRLGDQGLESRIRDRSALCVGVVCRKIGAGDNNRCRLLAAVQTGKGRDLGMSCLREISERRRLLAAGVRGR